MLQRDKLPFVHSNFVIAWSVQNIGCVIVIVIVIAQVQVNYDGSTNSRQDASSSFCADLAKTR